MKKKISISRKNIIILQEEKYHVCIRPCIYMKTLKNKKLQKKHSIQFNSNCDSHLEFLFCTKKQNFCTGPSKDLSQN